MKGAWRKSFLTAIGSALADSARRIVDSIASVDFLLATSAACLIVFLDMLTGKWEDDG